IRPTNDSMASGVFSSGKATATYPNGKPLGKLANFVKANYGKPARMCVTARANNAYGTIALSANNFVSKQSDGTYFKSKYFDTTKNYKKYCINFKIISQKAYEANNGEFYTPAEVWVQNVTYDSTIFIDNVKISLR
ncbi:hypothetical protein KDA14_06355, partial [Candidatus Saccharibacteria bacterium]|nr:hypothetical protein [Candidatus Saccharibacteria bacterium]